MSVIARLRGVERSFANSVKALGPLDLDIAGGEFLSLLGPSGCGKSTALRIIAELLAPTGGELIWPEGKPRIGFVFQDPTLMPWAIVRDNVRLPLDLEGVPRPGRIASEIRPAAPQARNAKWRLTSEFAESARQVSLALRNAMAIAA